jgi:hypothetical protein
MNITEKLFNSKLKIINMGLKSFTQAFKDTDCSFVQMNWSPPAGGDFELLKIIDNLKGDKNDY